MRERKPIYIKCPVCGREYMPAEIYLPNSFLGRPTQVQRDATTGKIDNFYGTDMDLVEHYTCDKCNTPFKVVAKVQFNTFEEDKYNFNKDYTVSLRKQPIFLTED